MSPFTINVRPKLIAAGQSEITVVLAGHLDNATAASFEAALTPLLAATPRHLILDLAALQFITSTGFRLFLIAAKQQKQHGGQIAFVNLQPQIKEVFAIMGSVADLRIYKDQAELAADWIAHPRPQPPEPPGGLARTPPP